MRQALLALRLVMVVFGVVFGAVFGGLGGCASLAKDQTVCPEYRDLRCPAGASCSLDQGRGCRVCQCNAINTMGPVSSPDQNVPPPVVVPQN